MRDRVRQATVQAGWPMTTVPSEPTHTTDGMAAVRCRAGDLHPPAARRQRRWCPGRRQLSSSHPLTVFDLTRLPAPPTLPARQYACAGRGGRSVWTQSPATSPGTDQMTDLRGRWATADIAAAVAPTVSVSACPAASTTVSRVVVVGDFKSGKSSLRTPWWAPTPPRGRRPATAVLLGCPRRSPRRRWPGVSRESPWQRHGGLDQLGALVEQPPRPHPASSPSACPAPGRRLNHRHPVMDGLDPGGGGDLMACPSSTLLFVSDTSQEYTAELSYLRQAPPRHRRHLRHEQDRPAPALARISGDGATCGRRASSRRCWPLGPPARLATTYGDRPTPSSRHPALPAPHPQRRDPRHAGRDWRRWPRWSRCSTSSRACCGPSRRPEPTSPAVGRRAAHSNQRATDAGRERPLASRAATASRTCATTCTTSRRRFRDLGHAAGEWSPAIRSRGGLSTGSPGGGRSRSASARGLRRRLADAVVTELSPPPPACSCRNGPRR
jgi:hypothetical protein